MTDRASITTDTSGLDQDAAESAGTARERPTASGRVLIGVVALFVALAVVALFPWGRHQLAISFTRQTATGTELYFVDPDGLVRSLRVGEPTDIRFAVANREGSSITYRYVVTATSATGSIVVDRGDVTIDEGNSSTIISRFTPADTASTYVIEVSLAGRDEQIRFRGRT